MLSKHVDSISLELGSMRSSICMARCHQWNTHHCQPPDPSHCIGLLNHADPDFYQSVQWHSIIGQCPQLSPQRGTTSVIRAGLWLASLGLAFNPINHHLHYLVRFPPDLNPQLGFSASSGISEWSVGVWVRLGVGHVMAYATIGLRMY